MKCLFIFVHFVGAEGLVIIRCPATRYLPCVGGTRCVWVNFTSSNSWSIKQIICRTRNRILIYTYIYDNLRPMSNACSLYPDYSSLRRLYKNLAYALTLGGSQPNPAPPEAYFNFIVAQPILGKKCDKEEGIHGTRARQSLDAILRSKGLLSGGKGKKKSDITFATTKRARHPPQHTRRPSPSRSKSMQLSTPSTTTTSSKKQRHQTHQPCPPPPPPSSPPPTTSAPKNPPTILPESPLPTSSSKPSQPPSPQSAISFYQNVSL